MTTEKNPAANQYEGSELSLRMWNCRCLIDISSFSYDPCDDPVTLPLTNYGDLVRCEVCGTWRSEGVPV